MNRLLLVFGFAFAGFSCFGADKKVVKANSKDTAKEAQVRKEIDVAASKVEWLGKKIFVESSHTGIISLKSGYLNMKGDKILGGEFVIDMHSIVNLDLPAEDKKKNLVDHLKSDDFFAVDKYPEAKFVLTGVDSSNHVKGKLTIRDKTQAIDFPATITKEGGRYVATANVKFDRTKFNVRYNSSNVKAFAHLVKSAKEKVIADEIEVTLNLVTK